MKLRSLAVNQLKKFARPTQILDMRDGLNVLIGPNEMGKSTLLQALRAVLFEKHGSKAQPVQSLQNDRNGAAPVVALTFELDGGNYTITKRFLKKPFARLRCPDGRELQGDAAESELRGLLRFEEPGRSGANAETIGMWNVLWVQQGQSLGALSLPESARADLQGALEAEVGAVLGGRRGQALPGQIEAQLGQFVTQQTRAPKGRYKQAIEEVAQAKDDLEVVRTKRDTLARSFDELEETQATLRRLDAAAAQGRELQELETARRRHRELSEIEHQIGALRPSIEVGLLTLQAATEACARRRALRSRITEVATGEAAAEQELALRRVAVVESEAAHDRRRQALRSAEAAVAAAELDIRRARQVAETVERQAEVAALEKRLADARLAETRLREARAGAALIRVDERALQSIEVKTAALTKAEGSLAAAATRITFDMPPEAQEGLLLDGSPLPAHTASFQALERTAITIPGRGCILVEPAIADRERLLREQAKARIALEAALQMAGASDLADAQVQHRRRRQLLDDAKLAEREAALVAPGGQDHGAGAQALSDRIEVLRTKVLQDLAALLLDTLPDRGAASARLDETLAAAEVARAARDTAKAAVDAAEQTLVDLRSAFAMHSGRHEALRQQRQAAERELSAAVAAASDTVLEEKQAEAERNLADRRRQVETLQAQLGGTTAEQLQVRIGRLEGAIAERQTRRQTLNIRITALQAAIEAQEGAGLAEDLAKRERAIALLEEECARYRRDVQILSLLLDTLRAAEHKAKERYLAPVLDRVRPYLQFLFPGAELALDEDLGIIGVIRQPDHQEAFDALSMGTQEQIAILVRLAFAQMLGEQGRPAAIILDDALAYSDDDRLGSMFDVLSRAARGLQVIVLTCREQVFQALGGHQLTLAPANSDDLESA